MMKVGSVTDWTNLEQFLLDHHYITYDNARLVRKKRDAKKKTPQNGERDDPLPAPLRVAAQINFSTYWILFLDPFYNHIQSYLKW